MAGWFWVSFYLGLLPLLVAAKADQRNFRLVFDEILLKPVLKEYFEVLECNLTDQRNHSFLNCNMILRTTVNQVVMETGLDMFRPNNQIMHIYNVRVDLCKFLTNAHKNPMINILSKSVTSGLNAKLKCPILAHFNYTLTNWHLMEAEFPRYVPECRLKALTKFYTQDKLAISMTLRGRIVQQK